MPITSRNSENTSGKDSSALSSRNQGENQMPGDNRDRPRRSPTSPQKDLTTTFNPVENRIDRTGQFGRPEDVSLTGRQSAFQMGTNYLPAGLQSAGPHLQGRRIKAPMSAMPNDNAGEFFNGPAQPYQHGVYNRDEDSDFANDYFDDDSPAQPFETNQLSKTRASQKAPRYIQSETFRRHRNTGRQASRIGLRKLEPQPAVGFGEAILNRIRNPPSLSLVTSVCQSPGVWTRPEETGSGDVERSAGQNRTSSKVSEFVNETDAYRFRQNSCSFRSGSATRCKLEPVGYGSTERATLYNDESLIDLSDDESGRKHEETLNSGEIFKDVSSGIGQQRLNNDVKNFSVGTSPALATTWSVLNLVQGLGTLGLPYAFATAGWTSIVCLFLVDLIGRYTSSFLGDLVFLRPVEVDQWGNQLTPEYDSCEEETQAGPTETKNRLQFEVDPNEMSTNQKASYQATNDNQSTILSAQHSYSSFSRRRIPESGRHLREYDALSEVVEEEIEACQVNRLAATAPCNRNFGNKIADLKNENSITMTAKDKQTRSLAKDKEFENDDDKTEATPVLVHTTYSCIGKRAYSKYGQTIVSISVMLEMFGAISLYFTLLGNSTFQILDYYASENGLSQMTITVITGFINLPFMLTQNVHLIAWLSLIAMLCQISTLILFMTYCLSELYFRSFDNLEWSNFLYPNFSKVPGALGIIIFSYCVQSIVPGVKANMKQPKKFERVISAAFTMSTVVKLVLGLVPALLFGASTSQTITENMGNRPLFLLSTNANIAINALCSVPLLATAIVKMIDLMALPRIGLMQANESSNPKPKYCPLYYAWVFVTRLGLISAVLFSSIMLPEFSLVMAIVGVLTGSSVCFILPTILNLKLLGWKYSRSGQAVRIAINLFGWLITIVGTYYSAKDLCEALQKK